MSITGIIQFTAEAPVYDNVEKVVQILTTAGQPQSFVIGTQLRVEKTVQITVDVASPDANSAVSHMRDVLGEPQSTLRVNLNQSVFGSEGPAMAKVVEYAQSWFPVSRVTPEFQRQIEADFERFDEIFVQESGGQLGLAFGWGVDELEHVDVQDRKAKSFVIIRGWETIGDFERSVQTESYRKAIPILFAWNAPFKLWHIERKL